MLCLISKTIRHSNNQVENCGKHLGHVHLVLDFHGVSTSMSILGSLISLWPLWRSPFTLELELELVLIHEFDINIL